MIKNAKKAQTMMEMAMYIALITVIGVGLLTAMAPKLGGILTNIKKGIETTSTNAQSSKDNAPAWNPKYKFNN